MTNPIDTNSRNLRLVGAGILGLVLLVFAISLWKSTPTDPVEAPEPVASETTTTAAETTEAAPIDNRTGTEPVVADRTVMVLGDSISAAYGLEESTGWVNLMQSALDASHPGTLVINASVSGETTTGGLQRLPEALSRFSPDIVIIELGGNDGLRGQSLSLMRDNLNKMVELTQATGATPILVGMRIPPNYGKVYADGFHQTFLDVASEKSVPLVPFLLESIAEDRQYFQADGIHPTKEAQPLLLDQVFSIVDTVMSNTAQPN